MKQAQMSKIERLLRSTVTLLPWAALPVPVAWNCPIHPAAMRVGRCTFLLHVRYKGLVFSEFNGSFWARTNAY